MVRLSKEKQMQIRNDILKVAKNHFLDKGYDDTRTKEIAKEVGIAEGTLFNYFDSKADIFLQALAAGHIIDIMDTTNLNFENDICDILYEFIYTPYKNLIGIPRKIIREVIGASITIAKKNPSLMRKLIQIDYNVIEDLTKLIQTLIDNKKIKNCNAKVAAETIFAVVLYEISIYLYESQATKETLFANIKAKIHFAMAEYIL